MENVLKLIRNWVSQNLGDAEIDCQGMLLASKVVDKLIEARHAATAFHEWVTKRSRIDTIESAP
jgi:hypothetical protein